MREIVLDTETTGFKPEDGHRLVEIGCIELVNLIPTGRSWHHYINPERDVPAEAASIHGLTTDKLRDKPVFSSLAADFLDFIGDAPLVIHNAKFDMTFLNAELKALGFPVMPMTRAIDTVDIARKRYPGAPASLDALCKRFGIDNSNRTFHGALLDASLLASVYLELRGGKQPELIGGGKAAARTQTVSLQANDRPVRPPRPHAASPDELAAHAAMIGKLKNPIWPAP